MSTEPAVPENVLAAIRAPFAALKAQTIDPPVIQPLSLLLDLAGEAMRSRLLVVQGEGDQESCLRPDFTIPVTRVHIESGEGACRYVYEGKAFRVAAAGSGRVREFLQIGLEAFGGDQPASVDGEIAAIAWRAAFAGGRRDLSLMMGDAALFSAFIAALGLAAPLTARLKRAHARPRALRMELSRAQAEARPARQGDRVSALLAGLPEAEAKAVLEDLWALAGIAPVGGRSAGEIVHRLVQRTQQAGGPRLSDAEATLVHDFLAIADRPRAALDQVAALAKRGGFNLDSLLDGWSRRLAVIEADAAIDEAAMTLSTGFGRAFGYYDGFLFEVRSASLGDEMAVAGGGRYDSLPARLGGSGRGGAVGCMVRPARAWANAEIGS